MKKQGFTLVELLVAMAIVGILGSVIIAFFTGTSRGINEQTVVATQTAAVQRILGLVGDDIRRSDKINAVGSSTPLSIPIAAIVPPTSVGTERMDVLISTDLAGTSNCASGYEYRSYFRVDRSTLTATGVNTWVALNNDPANNDKKVLVLYIGCTPNQASDPTYRTVRLVMDHVNSLSFTVAPTNITVTLQAARTTGSRTLRSPITPASATYYSRRL